MVLVEVVGNVGVTSSPEGGKLDLFDSTLDLLEAHVYGF